MSTASQPDRADPPASGASSEMVSVTIGKPAETGLADWMSQLRDWFDTHGIEPAGFKCSTSTGDNQTYEVSFPDRAQADLFADTFNQKHLR